jgi:NADPH-dependent ferric siderophore reductase
MSEPAPRPSRRPNRPPPRPVEVRRVEQLTPHMVRVTVTGEALDGYPIPGPAAHLKVFFPTPDQPLPSPVVTDASLPRPTNRTYTPRRWNPASKELDVDFLLHGDGPGATWAAQAQPGAPLGVGAPRGAYQLDPAAQAYLIAGDESALPAIGTLLEALPVGTRAQVYLEVQDGTDELPLRPAAEVDVTWLHRGAAADGAGRLLEAAVRDAKLADGGAVWVACEASVMRNIRAHLLHDRRLERGLLHTQGYWRVGAANHPDHDTGEDV